MPEGAGIYIGLGTTSSQFDKRLPHSLTKTGNWHTSAATYKWEFRPYFAQVLVDVGRFDSEEDAARAYDRAAVWCLGLTAQTNFPVSDLIQVGHSAC
jgi:hypothetical protein